MIQKIDIERILKSLIHPEEGKDVVSLGMIKDIVISAEKVSFVLELQKVRDPFASKLKRFAQTLIEQEYPEYQDKITIIIKEPAPKELKNRTVEYPTENRPAYGKVIAISSCKGGVGKSTTTANVAVSLAKKGYRVGLLDADVYGPSIPKMFGIEDYKPMAERVGEVDMIMPAEKFGVKIMSIGFFVDPSNALIWRGAMATSAIKQMIGQTLWGDLDFLIVDFPPGTGDIHLTVLGELKLDGAIIVSTPQQIALADVVRGVDMFRNEKFSVNILGLIENMAWFTPEELPDNRYYIFGKEGCKNLAQKLSLSLLAQIPLVQSIGESSDSGVPQSVNDTLSAKYYSELADVIIEKVK